MTAKQKRRLKWTIRRIKVQRFMRRTRATLHMRLLDDLVWECRDKCEDFMMGGQIRCVWDMWGAVQFKCKHGSYTWEMWGAIPYGYNTAFRRAAKEFMEGEHPDDEEGEA